jgi:hypothetical protein
VNNLFQQTDLLNDEIMIEHIEDIKLKTAILSDTSNGNNLEILYQRWDC